MAGTLVLTTLSDGTNSTSATNAIQGSAKAWVNFNGASGAIRASYNVSSVTRTTTGEYTVNFTNAFADTNYAVSGIVQYNTSGNQGDHYLMGAEITNISDAVQTDKLKVCGKYGGAVSTYDQSVFCVTVFR